MKFSSEIKTVLFSYFMCVYIRPKAKAIFHKFLSFLNVNTKLDSLLTHLERRYFCFHFRSIINEP